MTTAAIHEAAPAAARAASARAFGDEPGWRWLTFGPALGLMVVFSLLPLVNMAAMSFYEVRWAEGQAIWTSVGLDNYRALAGDALFRAGLWNTIVFVIAAVGAQMVLGFFLALFCSRIARGRIFFRTVFILPILIPGIVIGAMWKLMYNFDFGLINAMLAGIGIGPQDWLGDTSTALLAVIVVDIWHWTPFCFLLMLAGIESLPQDMYEAARIDGATPLQELVYITLPLMAPTIVITLAFRMVLAFKVFDEVYLLTSGGPGTATEVLSFTIYQRFFTEDKMGYGSAMAIAVIFIVALFLVAALGAKRRIGSTP